MRKEDRTVVGLWQNRYLTMRDIGPEGSLLRSPRYTLQESVAPSTCLGTMMTTAEKPSEAVGMQQWKRDHSKSN